MISLLLCLLLDPSIDTQQIRPEWKLIKHTETESGDHWVWRRWDREKKRWNYRHVVLCFNELLGWIEVIYESINP